MSESVTGVGIELSQTHAWTAKKWAQQISEIRIGLTSSEIRNKKLEPLPSRCDIALSCTLNIGTSPAVLEFVKIYILHPPPPRHPPLHRHPPTHHHHLHLMYSHGMGHEQVAFCKTVPTSLTPVKDAFSYTCQLSPFFVKFIFLYTYLKSLSIVWEI